MFSLPKIAYTSAELALDVGAKILAVRAQKGITQAQLAELVGTKQPAIARAERGGALPSLDFLLRIAEVLGTGVVTPTFGSLLVRDVESEIRPLAITTHSQEYQVISIMPQKLLTTTL